MPSFSLQQVCQEWDGQLILFRNSLSRKSACRPLARGHCPLSAARAIRRKTIYKEKVTGADPVEVGLRTAEKLIEKGAKKLIDDVKKELDGE
ncbi:Uncharacterised protein [Mycobacteroides abscessus subsp. abscessus]|nr:Uncharacterised protein [Mycobacteroides abscessus subsp. abscessus]